MKISLFKNICILLIIICCIALFIQSGCTKKTDSSSNNTNEINDILIEDSVYKLIEQETEKNIQKIDAENLPADKVQLGITNIDIVTPYNNDFIVYGNGYGPNNDILANVSLVDAQGAPIWQRVLGGDNLTAISSIKVFDDNILCVGYSNSKSGGINSYDNVNAAILYCLDYAGEITHNFIKSEQNTSYNFSDICMLSDNTIIAAGTRYIDDKAYGYIAKIDENGNLIADNSQSDELSGCEILKVSEYKDKFVALTLYTDEQTGEQIKRIDLFSPDLNITYSLDLIDRFNDSSEPVDYTIDAVDMVCYNDIIYICGSVTIPLEQNDYERPNSEYYTYGIASAYNLEDARSIWTDRIFGKFGAGLVRIWEEDGNIYSFGRRYDITENIPDEFLNDNNFISGESSHSSNNKQWEAGPIILKKYSAADNISDSTQLDNTSYYEINNSSPTENSNWYNIGYFPVNNGLYAME